MPQPQRQSAPRGGSSITSHGKSLAAPAAVGAVPARVASKAVGTVLLPRVRNTHAIFSESISLTLAPVPAPALVPVAGTAASMVALRPRPKACAFLPPRVLDAKAALPVAGAVPVSGLQSTTRRSCGVTVSSSPAHVGAAAHGAVADREAAVALLLHLLLLWLGVLLWARAEVKPFELCTDSAVPADDAATAVALINAVYVSLLRFTPGAGFSAECARALAIGQVGRGLPLPLLSLPPSSPFTASATAVTSVSTSTARTAAT